MESFNCALRQKILLQGHLYVFKHCVAFYCNIFGYTQKKVILLKVRPALWLRLSARHAADGLHAQDVTTIRKRKSYGLPNAIQVEHAGHSELFTSFLNRREAYKLIIASWAASWWASRLLGSALRLGLSLDMAAAATMGPWCSAPHSVSCTSL